MLTVLSWVELLSEREFGLLSPLDFDIDGSGTRMNPVFEIEGVEVVLHPLDTVSAALDQLGEHVGSLAEQGQRIADAMDELLTRSWG